MTNIFGKLDACKIQVEIFLGAVMTRVIAISKKDNQHWVILAVIYMCFLTSAITFQSVPPILSLVMNELDLSHTQGGLLMSFFALPGIIISIPAGQLADRYGQKVIGIVSLLLMSAGGGIFASGNSIAILALGRVISGIGAMILLVISPQLVAQWFSDRKLGIAMGIFTTGMPVGTILSMSILSVLGELLGWRTTVWLSAGLPILALLIFVLLYAPASSKGMLAGSQSKGLFRDIRQAGLSIWVVGTAWIFFNAAFISLLTFTPDLLKTAGYGITVSGFFTSLIMLPQLPLNPAVGYAMDRLGRKQTIIACGGLCFAILVGVIPMVLSLVLVLMLLIGMVTSLIPPPIFALPSEVVSPAKLGLGYGILSTCQNIGVLFGPAASGLAIDLTNSYQGGYTLMSGFAVVIALSMIFLIRISKQRPGPIN